MRKVALYLVVALQVTVLAYMAGNREYIRSMGDELWLPTAPIDPRDPFRGDFVRLRYAINRAPVPEHLKVQDEFPRGAVVYAELRETVRGTYEFVDLLPDPPSSGAYLKGRVSGRQLWRDTHVDVKYGIEQLFVQQGRGQDIEDKRGRRGEVQVPMEVLLAVGSDGTSVVKDYRWSELGARLEVLRSNRRDTDRNPLDLKTPLSPQLWFTLANVSTEPVDIVESEELCQLVLVAAFDPSFTPLATPRRCAEGFSTSVRRLAPGEEVGYNVDLSLPLWRVHIAGRDGELGELFDDWSDQFRVVYRPVGEDEVWQGRLPSQAFSVFGRID